MSRYEYVLHLHEQWLGRMCKHLRSEYMQDSEKHKRVVVITLASEKWVYAGLKETQACGCDHTSYKLIWWTFTFSHLADAFVQSDVQGREQSSYDQ